MNSGLIGGKWLIGAAVVGAAFATGRSARAEGTAEGETHGEVHATAPAETHAEAKEEHDAKGEPHGHHEEKYIAVVYADFVLGFGKGPLALQNPATSLSTLPGYRPGAAQVTSESLILGAAIKVLPHTSIGLRLPLSFGTFHPPGADTRGTAALGNIEIEGEYERHLEPDLAFLGVLGVSLPTAQGDPIPENLEQLSNQQVDQGAYDKGGINRAAAYSRGLEENALFFPKRLGINPKVGIIYRNGGFSVAPYIKMENLIGTTKSTNGYLGELVPGVRVAYRAGHFEPALKAWATVAFAGAEEDEKKVGLALEPQVALHLENVRWVLGAVVPVVGPAADPQFIGIRLALAGAF